MLRIAVQSKGRLFEDTMALFAEADIKLSTSKRTLLTQSSNFPIEVLFLRDDDIPQSVASGVADLGIVGENEFVLLDIEAGVEHFGRCVYNSVDLILMIVDPSFESLKLTKKIQQLGESIGKPVFFVLNKVNELVLPTMLESIDDQSKVLAVISTDTEIARKGLVGDELMMEIPEIHMLARKILKQ